MKCNYNYGTDCTYFLSLLQINNENIEIDIKQGICVRKSVQCERR